MNYIDYIKEQTSGKKICICPMGVGGKEMYNQLQRNGITVDFFADLLVKEPYNGVTCISYAELAKYGENVVIIIETSKYYKEIKDKLKEMGLRNFLRLHYFRFNTDKYIEQEKDLAQKVKETCELLYDDKSRKVLKHICSSWSMLQIPEDYFLSIISPEDKIYFDEEIIPYDPKRKISFVDCGAYNGDTSLELLKRKIFDVKAIYMFEIDPDIYKKLIEKSETIKDIVSEVYAYPYGVYDENKKLRLSMGNGSSMVNDVGIDVDVVTLDSILVDKKVDYIKMDIEGSEYNALKGGIKTISKNHPILAICLYHKPSDMFTIPHLIRDIDPTYKIYIRHYSDTMFDSVCYAV